MPKISHYVKYVIREICEICEMFVYKHSEAIECVKN